MKIGKLQILALCVMSALALTPTRAQAFISIGGTGSLGSYTGSLDYSFTNATTAELEIILTNTSPADNGGYLTAFVFNNPDNLISGVSLTPSDADFVLLGGALFNNGINGAPYGKFDIGASTGGSFEGGGNPSKGLAVGASGTFTFSLTGTNLNTLTDQSFLDELSVPPGDGQGHKSFVARFRGFEDDGSDKVPGTEITTTTTPEPASALLLGSGLLAALSRRKRKA